MALAHRQSPLAEHALVPVDCSTASDVALCDLLDRNEYTVWPGHSGELACQRSVSDVVLKDVGSYDHVKRGRPKWGPEAVNPEVASLGGTTPGDLDHFCGRVDGRDASSATHEPFRQPSGARTEVQHLRLHTSPISR